jgi:hypothetical protein
MMGAPIAVSEIRVGDFVKVVVASGTLYFGVIIYIDKEAVPWPTATTGSPQRLGGMGP